MLTSRNAAIAVAVLLSAGSLWYLFSDSPPATAGETTDAKLQKLLNERVDTLREVVGVTAQQYESGSLSFDRLHQATRTLMNGELDACNTDDERLAVLGRILAQAKKYEKHIDSSAESGTSSMTDALMAKACRLEAEIDLERAMAKAP